MKTNNQTLFGINHSTLFYLILASAAVVRFVNMGTFSFWIDELYHVFAAQSYLADGSLTAPFKGEYTRSLPTTWITIAAFKLFGISEWSARVPFVISNLLFIWGGYILVKKLFSSRVALMFVFVLAFSPFVVGISREARMYAPFQLFYFGASIFFLMGIENISLFKGKSLWPKFIIDCQKKLDVNITSFVFCLLFLAISATFHQLTFNFAFVVSVYLFLMIIYEGYKNGTKTVLQSKYFYLFGLEVLIFLFVLLFQGDFFGHMMVKVKEVPENFQYINPLKDYSFYRYYLTDNFPVLFFLFPLGLFYLAVQYGKKGLFVGLSFAVLIILHSFIYERKADRYFFYIFPFFVLGSVVALDKIGPLLWKGLETEVREKSKWLSILLFIFGIPVVYGITHPWLLNSIKLMGHSRFPDWKAISKERRDVIERGTVIAGNPNEFKYYFSQNPSYYFLADYNPEEFTYEKGRIKTYEEFRKAVESNDDTVVVTTRFTFANNANFTPKIRAYILGNMLPVDQKNNSEILVFRRPKG